MVTHNEFERANARGRARQRNTPRAISVTYEKSHGQIVVAFNTGATFSFRPSDTQGLETAKATDLRDIEISPSGFGLHFPKLDVDLYIPALLEGFFGSRRWAAAQLGTRGGKTTSEAKARAARANGALGGRPRKRDRELV